MAPLVVENAVKKFRQGERWVTALNGVSFEVASGQFWAIMGASGSGKSTLLHLMSGLTNPDSGKILIDGRDISAMSDAELTHFRRERIGLVFQAFNLIPTLTAEENIALPLVLGGQRNSAANGRARDILKQLGLEDRAGHRPDAMSGGEQQRVAIGRALVTEPAVILADEPTGNLDSANGQAVCGLLRDLSVIHGRTMVLVTHEPAVAAHAQFRLTLNDGKISESVATPEKILAHCRSCGARLGGEARFCQLCGMQV